MFKEQNANCLKKTAIKQQKIVFWQHLKSFGSIIISYIICLSKHICYVYQVKLDLLNYKVLSLIDSALNLCGRACESCAVKWNAPNTDQGL